MQATTMFVRSGAANPGRWVGGLIGAIVCLGVYLAAVSSIPNGSSSGGGFFSWDFLTMVGVGGLPIAILGGRALLPAARSGGWLTAIAVGLGFGLLAPPLGGIEVIVFEIAQSAGSSSRSGGDVLSLLALSPIVLIYSYVVVVVTVPAGILWALIVRAIPQRGLDSVQAGTDALAESLRQVVRRLAG